MSVVNYNLQVQSSIFIKAAFILIFLDSLLVYFTKQQLGVIIPVNLTIPVLLIAAAVSRGPKHITPDIKTILVLSMTMLGFFAGVVILPEFGRARIFEIVSATIAFIVGFTFIKWSRDSNEVAPIFLLIGIAYSITCMIALSRISPGLFPVIDKVWSLNGTLINRPEVTTDQNFQIFYLIPGLLILSLPLKKLRLILTLVCFIGSLYALAKLQTRSGILVCFSVAVMCVIAPIWTKSLGRKKTYIFPIITALVAAISLPIILEYAHEIILRFTKTDFSTGLGRLHSLLYLFDNIYKPTWWIPHGNAEMMALTGNKPHSNPTGIFLDGGILSLTGWVILFVLPIFRLSKLFFKRKLDNLTTMLLIGCIAYMIIQLSLNVPLMDQIWLLAGALIGAEDRLKRLSSDNNTTNNEFKKNYLSDNTTNTSYDRYPKLRPNL